MGWPAAPSVHAAVGGAKSGTTSAINTASPACNFLVAQLHMYQGNVDECYISDSAGNTWIPLDLAAPNIADAQTNITSRLFVCLNPITSTTHTFSFTFGGTYSGYAVLCVQAWVAPANNVVVIDQQSASASGTSTTSQPGSITPSANGALIVTGCQCGPNTNVSINDSFTISDDILYSAGNYFGGAMGYLIQTTAAAVNPTWTASSGTNMCSSQASFKLVSTGGVAGSRIFTGM